ncbi:protein DD3-3-like [Gigantopelta aegis]|uniref:protein DD3-3-like n=1 Tax=Gigantopelta aegis TaxID=1735272 RepID=UPI001B889F46|nr:protein DD3-3-like [Gigantopelta aegis]
MNNQALLLLVFAGISFADIYLHVPRGSNNRLNEKSAARTNANRMFNSENNNRGGYNAGDATSEPSGQDEGKQYRMKYFQSGPWKTFSNGEGQSYLTLEWTIQHGCGGNEDTDPQKQNCVLVLQYMCQDDVNSATGTEDTLRNGVQTKRQDYEKPASMEETETAKKKRKTKNVKAERGLHESFDWYDKCYMRERNKGLFTADQKLKTNNGHGYSSAVYTRQNRNGNQYGYECPEDHDYYPYWHPTPWKDIAVFAENSTMCSHYQSKSFNVQPYGECVELYGAGRRRHWSRWNNPADCVRNGKQWVDFHNYLEKATEFKTEASCVTANKAGLKYVWGIPYDASDVSKKECLVQLDQPDCGEAPWSRSNHLGNGRDGQALNYTWILPHFPSGKTQRCVFRMRYNVSTDDYDPYNTDSRHNDGTTNKSPVRTNPYVEIGAGPSPLRLAINTAQFGRVFQDRSHVFLLRPRPPALNREKIFNLNVRGKRGNIVQVYPAVEYDFAPSYLNINEGDLVHIQWTGSNTHNNGDPEGDGQKGSDGEGKAGTDRNNLVQILDRNENFPIPFEKTTMWTNAEVKWIYHMEQTVSPKDLALSMASSGYYTCMTRSTCSKSANKDSSAETKDELNNLLNNAPASYEGAVVKFKKGIHHFICSRNNNFTNRSQKGTIIVR